MPEIFDTLIENIHQEKLIALATVITGSGVGNKLLIWPDSTTLGSLGSESLNQQAMRHVPELFHSLRSERIPLEVAGETTEVFMEVFPPPCQTDYHWRGSHCNSPGQFRENAQPAHHCD